MRLFTGLFLALASLVLGLPATPVQAEGGSFRETHVCAAMSADSSSGISYSTSAVKATNATRTLRTQARLSEGECVSYLEIAGSTTSPGGPVYAYLYVMRSGQQIATSVALAIIPEGKSGVYKTTIPSVCLSRGDAAYIVVGLNAGGGVPYETAACSYVAVGE